MNRRLKIHVIAAITIMIIFGMFNTMESKAASGRYDVFLELVDQSTGETVSNPNVKYTFYAEDGSVIKLGAESEYRNSAYFSNDKYMYYYYSGADKPVKVKVELNGWIFEKNIYDIVFEDSGTSGTVECRMEIPVWPDTSLETLTIQAGYQRGTSALDRTGKTIKIRKTGEKEFSQTAVTDDTGMVTFKDLPLSDYDVYCVEENAYYYIQPTATGERYAYFATYTDWCYFKLNSSIKYLSSYFKFEITTEDGVTEEYSSGTKSLDCNKLYYISTTDVPEGYTGNVLDHVLIIPYTNIDVNIEFEPEYNLSLYSMQNNNYNIYSDSKSGNFKGNCKGDDTSLIDAFTKFTFERTLKGTNRRIDNVVVEANETSVENVSMSIETEADLEVDAETIWVQKINNTTYTFDLVANINDKEVITPVTVVVSDYEEDNTYLGFIMEDAIKVTKTSNSVSMNWTAPNNYVSYYKVCRYSSTGTLLKEDKVKGTSFKHTGLTAGKTYKYKIYCVYKASNGEEYCCIPTLKEVKLISLKAVTNAKVSNNKQNSIKLTWNKVVNADGYQIKRLNTAGKTMKTLTTAKLTLTDTLLKAATKYTYKITPYYTDSGVKKFGPTVTLKTATVCKVPAAPTLKPSTKSMKVSFKKVAGANGYEIAYSTNKNFTAKTTKKVTVTGTSTTLSKTIKNLTKGKNYYIKVRAYVKTATGVKVYTGYSNVKNVKVK